MFHIRQFVNRFIGTAIRNKHGKRVVELGARFCDWYLFHYWNQQNWDVNTNGELLLLEKLSKYLHEDKCPVVFDVGANTGKYTRLVRGTLPGSKIYSFEIVPNTRETLKNNVSDLNDVFVATRGLSSANGVLQIGCTRANDTQSRVLTPLSVNVQEVFDCEVSTGDEFIAEHDIHHINLLKIDSEGHEMDILEGFQDAFEKARIQVIQFEYGTTWVAPCRFLYEAYALLEPYGFRIGRLYPDGVLFKSYDRVKDDHFRMGNYVAVHGDSSSLVDGLSLD